MNETDTDLVTSAGGVAVAIWWDSACWGTIAHCTGCHVECVARDERDPDPWLWAEQHWC